MSIAYECALFGLVACRFCGLFHSDMAPAPEIRQIIPSKTRLEFGGCCLKILATTNVICLTEVEVRLIRGPPPISVELWMGERTVPVRCGQGPRDTDGDRRSDT